MRVCLYPSKTEYARMFLDFAPLKLNMRVCFYMRTPLPILDFVIRLGS